MKALVLAAGRGSRLGPLSESRSKCLVPLRGRPIIHYSLSNARHAGVSSLVVVIGYRGDEIVDALGTTFEGLAVAYVRQPAATGVVDAMACAREALSGDDFMLFFADEFLVGPRHRRLVEQFTRESLFAVCGVVREDNPDEIRKTYAVEQDPVTGRVRRLLEKPDHPAPGIRGTGNCVFRHAILDYVERTPRNDRRGEREFPDLIQCAIDDGQAVSAAIVADGYVNVNTLEDLAAAETRLGRFDRGSTE